MTTATIALEAAVGPGASLASETSFASETGLARSATAAAPARFPSPAEARASEDRPVAELVRAAQAGDQDAFGALFERYRGGIVALAMRRVRHVDEAEELAQDVFIQAMQKIGQLRVPEAFGGWLRQIVYRMAINRITRSRAAIAYDPQTLEATCLTTGGPDEVAESRERAVVLRAGLARLNDLDQQTLQAFYLRGRSLLEMSDEFDAPVGTIKRRLHVARKRLAQEVDLLHAPLRQDS